MSERLATFCAAKYDDPDVAVSEVVTMPGHAGFAYGFAVTHRGGTDRWFLRLPPPNVRWEGTADMLRQVTALQALDGGDVPHCRVRWYGGPDDLVWFGCPYFVVEQLHGGDVIAMGGGSGWVGELSASPPGRHGPPGHGGARWDPPDRVAGALRIPRRTCHARARRHPLGPLHRTSRRARGARRRPPPPPAAPRPTASRRPCRAVPRRLPVLQSLLHVQPASCAPSWTGSCAASAPR